MESLLGVLICLSPLLIFAGGYYFGRYGSPIVLKFQKRQDRRRPDPAAALVEDDDSPLEIYQFPQTER